MGAIRTTDIWKGGPNMSSPGPSSLEEEVAVDMPMTDEENEFPTESEDVRTALI